MREMRWAGVTTLIVVLGMIVGVAAAQASDASVRAAIHKVGSQIKESPELKTALAESKSEKAATGKISPAKLISVISKFERSLKGAASTVGAQKASTSAGKQGEKLWLNGVQKLTKGFAALRVAIEDKVKKDKSAAKEEALDAAGDIVAAAKDLNRADKLLKISAK
jgi:hypothetical protein